MYVYSIHEHEVTKNNNPMQYLQPSLPIIIPGIVQSPRVYIQIITVLSYNYSFSLVGCTLSHCRNLF